MGRAKRIWYLLPMRAAKVQASLRIRAVSPEPPLLAHTSSESRGTFRQKARSLAPLNGWACAVKICDDGMLEDTNSLDRAHLLFIYFILFLCLQCIIFFFFFFFFCRIGKYVPQYETEKTKKMPCFPSEDSDQPAHPPSLISLRYPHDEILGT